MFVSGSKLGDGACCTLGGNLGAVICVLIIEGCTTGPILRDGAAGWVTIIGDLSRV